MSDLIQLIEHRIAMSDSIMANLAARKSARPARQQAYKDRRDKEFRERMEGVRKI